MTRATRTGTVNILLVDDDPAGVRLTREALAGLAPRAPVNGQGNGKRPASRQIRLEVAADGEQALAYLRREGRFAEAVRPDLNLPGRGGLEVLAEVKADETLQTIPVVVLTTSAADQDIRTGYRHHGNCFVTKPVDLDEFFQVVEQIAHFWLTVAHLPPE